MTFDSRRMLAVERFQASQQAVSVAIANLSQALKRRPYDADTVESLTVAMEQAHEASMSVHDELAALRLEE